MADFKRKTIGKDQSIANRLLKARLEKKLSLDDVYQETKIQVKYLEILESGDYHRLPGDIYARTWIKLYSQFLDLPANDLLADYKFEKSIREKISTSRQIGSKELIHILRPRILKKSAVILIILIFLGYLGWELNNIIAAPQIFITEPADNTKTKENNIKIIGHTEPEVVLMINNELILLDETGNFSKDINLSLGLNNLQISAKKKHSKTKSLELVVLREPID